MVRGGATAAARLPATLRCGGQGLPVTITAAGTKELVLEAPQSVMTVSGSVQVDFSLDAAGKKAPMRCQCVVQRQAPDGQGGVRVELQIEAIDEGGFEGLFARHVKWLHFREMAGT